MLLSSLPKSYDTLITALETRPENDLTLSLVQSKLIEESRKRSGGNKNESALKSTYTPAVSTRKCTSECFFCKKKGHIKRDCRHHKEWLQKNKGQANTAAVDDGNFAFISANGNFGGNWIVDSGA